MLIIKQDALPNGAHENQLSATQIEPPEGWLIVPDELESDAMSYLPFINMVIEDGEIVSVSQGKIPQEDVPNSQLREQAYQIMTHTKDGDALILWEGNAITVDTANDLWMKYAAENHPDADVLQELIRKAKEYIRDLYPDGRF